MVFFNDDVPSMFLEYSWIACHLASRSEIFHALIQERPHWWWRAVKVRHFLGACGLLEGRDLYRAIPCYDSGPRFTWSHLKDRPHLITSFYKPELLTIYVNPITTGLEKVQQYENTLIFYLQNSWLIDWLIDWLPCVLRRIGNIPAL